jgi:ribosomal protein S18 acetylase RimI-like enzyme
VSATPSVESADAADLDDMVATLVDSHLDYPWEAWAVQGDDRVERLAVGFRSDIEMVGLPYGVLTKCGARDAVAVWLPADRHLRADERERRRQLADAVFGDRRHLVDEVEAVVAAASCPDSDWYLATMGTRPERQRQGLGSAVLGPMLEHLDRSHESARLETSTTGNVRFYRRLGFEVVTELELPHGAPTTWIMHRPRSTVMR